MDDYQSAALRHYRNAITLWSAGEFDNAGHLIGFAAECAIKFHIRTLSSNPDGPKGHLPEILTIAKRHLGSRSAWAMLDLLKREMFIGWAIDRRCHCSGHTPQHEVELWISDTQRIFACAKLKSI